MRTKIVKVAEKEIIVQEKRIKELKELSEKIALDFKSFIGTDLENKNTNEVFENVFEMLRDKLIIIFPTLTDEDVENAYMSELEELLTSFLEINFMGAKKVITQVMKLQ